MFCKHCGKSLSENQAFCDDCGTPTAGVSVTKVNPATPAPSHKFHCPHCGSEDLYPITSTEFTSSTSGGGFSAGKGCLGFFLLGPLGLLCGTCGSKTKTTVESSVKNYWSCRSCGKKFLDIDNLNSLLEQEKSNLGSTGFRFFFAVILAFVVAINALKHIEEITGAPEIFQFVGFIIIIAAISTPFIVLAQRSASKKRCEELEREKAFLEQYAYGGQDVAR